MNDEMKEPFDPAHDSSPLRQNAKELYKPLTETDLQNMPPHDVRKLLQELQIHQIELEMQNHQLHLAAQELEAAHAKYHDLYQHSPFGYVTLDEHGVIEEVNAKGAKLLAYRKNQLVPYRFSQFVPPDSRDAFYGFFKKILLSENTGETQTEELQIVSTNGTVFYALLEGMRLRRENNAAQCRIAFVDVTERKTADEELYTKEALLSAIFNSSHNGIQVFKAVRDSKGTLQDFEWLMLNRTAQLFLDYTLEQLRRRTLTEIMPSLLADGHVHTFVNVVETGQPAMFTAHFKDGKQERWLNCVAVKLDDGFVLTFENVTLQRIANEQLQESRLLVQKMAEAMPDFLYVEDVQQGRNLYNNRDFLAFLGYGKADIKAQPRELLDTLYHPEDAHLLFDRASRFSEVKDGLFLDSNVRVKAKNGTWRNILFRETVFKRGASGVPTQLMGIAQDITERLRAEEDLRQKNKTINTILESLPVIIWRLNAQGGIVESVGSGLRNLGYQDHELEGRNIKDISPSVSPNIALLLKGHKDVFIGEADVAGKKIYKQNYFIYDKETGGAVGFCLDITELKQAEAEAHHRTMLLDQVLHNLPMVFAVIDAEGKYVELRGKGLQSIGLQDNDLVGENIFKVFPELQKEISEILAGNLKTFTATFQHQNKKVHFQNFGFWDAHHQKAIAFGTDITELKEMQETLVNEKEFSQNLLEYSIDGILAFDNDLRITTWNKAMEDIMCLRREEVLGLSVLTLFPEEHHEFLKTHLGRVLEGHSITTNQIPGILTDRSFEINIFPFSNPENQIIGALCLAHDITQQQQRQKASTQIQLDQQKAVANAVVAAQEEERKRIAEALHNSLGQLLYAAKLNLEELVQEEHRPKASDAVAIKRVTGFLEDAIRETRTLAHELIPKALQDFGLKTALQDLARRLSTENFTVQCVVTGFETPVSSSLETVLYRIVQELLNNIMKHADASEALVQVLDKGEQVMVRVQDNGIGMTTDPKKLSSKGIGLHTIQNRVKLLQGHMTIRSKKDEGTVITIELKKE